MQKPSQEVVERFRERYHERRDIREARQDEIDREGVLPAAGLMAAVNRVSHLTVHEGRRVERISGGNDLASVNFLDFGRIAANYVCRILIDGIAMGTGFLVAPGVIMTNQHVIRDEADAELATLEFGFEIGIDGKPLTRTRFTLNVGRPFAYSHENVLDFAIYVVREPEIEQFGWLPLEARTDKILEGEPILIVQHPDGREKELCLFNSELVDRPDAFLHYTTDTEPGSSGSPVFNRQWQVVGLHHASLTLPIRHRGSDLVANEGIRISRIISSLETGRAEGNSVIQGRPRELFPMLTDPAVVRDGRPVAPISPLAPAASAPAAVVPEARGTRIRVRPAEDLQGRDGHVPRFLGAGFEVPLPEGTPAIERDFTRLIDGSGFELKYRHYSVAMSKSRRMAAYTIVDIDGERSKSLGRKERDWKQAEGVSPEAAADTWWYDPRIGPQTQLGPEVFDKTKFAFGHLVRREDPVWGDDVTAIQANDDTFYMTNCSPQHERFNSGTWLALENGILHSARESRKKFVVLTGPVLRFDDPEILGVQCPTAFWKIVAFKRGNRLVSYGFMQWQTKFVEEIEETLRRSESLTKWEDIRRFTKPISEIARATSLDFGPLEAADAGEGSRMLTESLIQRILEE